MLSGKPLTPPDCDLRDFEFMPLDVQRLYNSDFWLEATANHKAAAVELWGRSWHQTPAGSVPNKDAILAALSGAREVWPEVRDLVMRGWVDGGDGRLYHPVVCEKALEAWLEKLAQRVSSGHGNAKRWNGHFDDAHLQEQISVARPLLFALNPLSKAFSRKRTAVIEQGDKSKATQPAPSEEQKKPRAAKAVNKPLKTDSSRPDTHEIASKSKETVKGQGQGNEKSADAPLPDKPKAQTLADVELPKWMPTPQWNDFLAMRQSMGKSIPFTPAAARGIVRKLTQLKELGDDPAEVLEKSVRSGWRDVFALKGDRGGVRVGAFSQAGASTMKNAASAEERLFGTRGGDYAAQ